MLIPYSFRNYYWVAAMCEMFARCAGKYSDLQAVCNELICRCEDKTCTWQSYHMCGYQGYPQTMKVMWWCHSVSSHKASWAIGSHAKKIKAMRIAGCYLDLHYSVSVLTLIINVNSNHSHLQVVCCQSNNIYAANLFNLALTPLIFLFQKVFDRYFALSNTKYILTNKELGKTTFVRCS